MSSTQVVYHPPENPPPYELSPTGGYQHTGVITIQPTGVPTIIGGSNVGSKPTPFVCRSCSVVIVTRIEYKPSMRTHLMAAVLCIFGCWPCVCVPYCMETCNNVDHYCPNCNSFIGTYIH